MSLLSARALSRRFGGLRAVADVSIDLEAGQIHAVIGPNGAGKSTLINLLGGTLMADAGSIQLNGVEIGDLPDWRRARAGIGRSFQRANAMAGLTVRRNLILAASAGIGGWLRSRDRSASDRAEDALHLSGLADVADRTVAELSHGQRRLLEIGLVLAGGARVLLLDEPLAGLGFEETGPLAALVKNLARDRAILLVEHDMDVVFALADTVTVMVDGAVLESGPPETIRTSAAVRDAYLGHRA